MNKAGLAVAVALSVVITCAIVLPTSFVSGTTAAHQDSLSAYCAYNPDDPVFKDGRQAKYHPTHSPVVDVFVILLPVVNVRTTNTHITLLKDDRVTIRACGCVQTGGRNKTWKRYVNPSGPDSDKVYRGVIAMDNFIIVPPPGGNAQCCASSPTIPGTLRISDMIAAQNRGFRFQIRNQTELVLGYEDDDYGDNGYWGHDDGTEDQCRGVGGAALEITINHKVN